MSAYVETTKVEDGNKDENNKLMSFHIGDDRLLLKCKTIWIKIEDSKCIKLNALSVCDDRYIKTKMEIDSDTNYTNFVVQMYRKMM